MFKCGLYKEGEHYYLAAKDGRDDTWRRVYLQNDAIVPDYAYIPSDLLPPEKSELICEVNWNELFDGVLNEISTKK